jgi:GNAT superfamily N-acetyltransferase
VRAVEVHPIHKKELEDLLPLVASYQRFYRAEPSVDINRSFFAQFLHPSDKGLLIGGWFDGRLVGFATLYWTFSSTKAATSVLLNDLFVKEDVRGAGIGRRLIERALGEARRRGAAHLEWYTSPDNQTAQRLYDSYHGAVRTTWFAYEIDASAEESKAGS